MKPIRLIQLMILLLALFEAFSLALSARAQDPVDSFTLYIPASVKAGEHTPPPPPPPNGTLPAELVTTWFTGVPPLRDYYDPVTGDWADTAGLGEMYEFSANGDYIYAGFLRIQNGLCVTEVSVYKQGQGQAKNDVLTLQPSLSKTRTVIRCGSNSDTTTNGSLDPVTLHYVLGEDSFGRIQLTLTEGSHSTTFDRKGMVQSLVGAWHQGDVRSTNFYDPKTQEFAPQTGAGGWYRFSADGTYSYGEFGYGTNDQGCALTGWVYQEGAVSIAGGTLTTIPTSGMARIDNECEPGAPVVKSYVEAERSYAWSYRDLETDPKLLLIPLSEYKELVYLRE